MDKVSWLFSVSSGGALGREERGGAPGAMYRAKTTVWLQKVAGRTGRTALSYTGGERRNCPCGSKSNNHCGLCEQADFVRMAGGAFTFAPRFHGRHRFARKCLSCISWQPLGTWKPCYRCFRCNRGNRWNRGFRWYAWNRAFVGIVGAAQKKFAKSDQKSRAKGHTAAPAGGVVSWSRQKQTGRQGPRKGWFV